MTVNIDRFEITENYSDGTYTIGFYCITCNRPKPVRVPGQGLFKYRQGAFVQDAFPELPAEDRELFISGICGSCYDEMFREE